MLGHRARRRRDGETGLAHTSAPLIDVAQPRPDTLAVTMTGLAAAGGLPCEDSAAEVAFDLSQCVAVRPHRAQGPDALTLDAQLAGLFRGSRDGPGVGTFSVPAEATVTAGAGMMLHAGLPVRTHTGKDVLLVSDRASAGRRRSSGPGEVTLCQRFAIRCPTRTEVLPQERGDGRVRAGGREAAGVARPARPDPRHPEAARLRVSGGAAGRRGEVTIVREPRREGGRSAPAGGAGGG